MLNGTIGSRSNSLMSEYSSLLGDAILRHRTRVAEHSARIEAELASRVKSEFIANMSHELRTPLNTIVGFSKLLSEQDRRHHKNEDIVQYAQLINDAAGQLLAVINDILDISKIQSGKYTLDARQIALDEVLLACISAHDQQAKDAELVLERRIDFELPLIRGDATKLRQIFTNLIGNAVKFTRPGGTVTVAAKRQSDGGAIVRISDSGIGMSEEEMHVALTPFGQVDGGKARWREGTGLGLPIAKALVDLHGGKLSIASAKDQGTTVTVILPSRHAVAATSAYKEAAEGAAFAVR